MSAQGPVQGKHRSPGPSSLGTPYPVSCRAAGSCMRLLMLPSSPSPLSPGTWRGPVMLEVPFTWLQHRAEATREQAAAVGVGLVSCAWEKA